MTDKTSLIASGQEDASVQVLGETGGTVVYIFPSGNAKVKKGQKQVCEQIDSSAMSSQGSSTKSSLSPRSEVQPVKSQSAQMGDRPSSQSLNTQTLREHLLKSGLVTATQLEVADYDLETTGLSLEEVLVARGWITQEAIAQIAAKHL